MTELSSDAVIRIGGLTGEANSITVGDLKALILESQITSRYQGLNVETLEPGGTWIPSIIGIKLTIDDGN